MYKQASRFVQQTALAQSDIRRIFICKVHFQNESLAVLRKMQMKIAILKEMH
jgi:hypothetical protein